MTRLSNLDGIILNLLSRSVQGEAGRLYYSEEARHPALGPWVDRKTTSNFFDRETELVGRMRTELSTLARDRLTMVDLGPGSAGAVRNRAATIFSGINSRRYVAVDVSHDFLSQATKVIDDLFPAASVKAISDDFLTTNFHLELQGPYLIYMGGSTFSNYPVASYEAFPFGIYSKYLRHLRRVAGEGGYLLLGWHSARSREEALVPYEGAEASYYLETPLRVMIELGAQGVEPDQWTSSPMWHEESRCVSHGLTALRDCKIAFSGQEFQFHRGDRLVLNQSYKISAGTMYQLATEAGLTVQSGQEHANGYSLWLLKS